MNLQRLSYFLSLAETGNYTETAEQLYTTQGNVSKQIKALERELNIILFHRNSHRVSLTKEGELLLPYASRLLEDYEDMKRQIQSFFPDQPAQVRIGAIPALSRYRITDFFGSFTHKYPQYNLLISESTGAKLLEGLDKGLFDIGYLRIFQIDSQRYEKIVYSRDQFMVILPASHPLRHRKAISLSQIAQEKFLQLDDEILCSMLIHLCSQKGFQPNIAYKTSIVDNIIDMICHHMGVSVMAQKSADLVKNDQVVQIPLKEEASTELVFLRLRKSRYPGPVQMFWEYLLQSRNRMLLE